MLLEPPHALLAAFSLTLPQFHILQKLVRTPSVTLEADGACPEDQLENLRLRGLIHKNRGGLWVATVMGCTILQSFYYAIQSAAL